MDYDSKLTAKQRAFIREYLISLNATDAARKAGYSVKNADKIGPELLGNSRVSQVLRENERKIQDNFEVTQERIIRELAAIAFGNLGDIVDETGQIKDSSKAAYLSGISRSDSSGAEGSSSSFSISAHNKVKALELLGKHRGMWKADKDAGEGNNTDNRKAILTRVSDLLRKSKK